jgi:hypothetical protein
LKTAAWHSDRGDKNHGERSDICGRFWNNDERRCARDQPSQFAVFEQKAAQELPCAGAWKKRRTEMVSAPLGVTTELTVAASPVTFFDPHGPIATVTLRDPSVEATLVLRLSRQSLLELVEPSDGSAVYARLSGLRAPEIAEYRREEARLAQRDAAEIAVDNARNELESLLFEVESDVLRDAIAFFAPDEVEEARRATADVRHWFGEHEMERLRVGEYRERLARLRSVAGLAMERRRAVRLFLDEEGPLRARAAQLLERAEALGLTEANAGIGAIVAELDKAAAVARETPHLGGAWMLGKEIEDGFAAIEAQIADAQAQKKKSKWCNVA